MLNRKGLYSVCWIVLWGVEMIVGQKGGYLAALVSLVLTSTIVMYFVLCTFFFQFSKLHWWK